MLQVRNHLNHATWECKYHVVFTPNYRKKLLFGQIRRHLEALWNASCAIFLATNSGQEAISFQPSGGTLLRASEFHSAFLIRFRDGVSVGYRLQKCESRCNLRPVA
jgi:hypothetical protein